MGGSAVAAWLGAGWGCGFGGDGGGRGGSVYGVRHGYMLTKVLRGSREWIGNGAGFSFRQMARHEDIATE